MNSPLLTVIFESYRARRRRWRSCLAARLIILGYIFSISLGNNQMAKLLEIRNSTAEFLTFLAENKEDGVQVVYKDENIWATQVAMGELFDCSSDNIGLHLKNIYAEGELLEPSTAEKISVVQMEGTRKVNREPMFYNLDAIISVGYRVNSV